MMTGLLTRGGNISHPNTGHGLVSIEMNDYLTICVIDQKLLKGWANDYTSKDFL